MFSTFCLKIYFPMSKKIHILTIIGTIILIIAIFIGSSTKDICRIFLLLLFINLLQIENLCQHVFKLFLGFFLTVLVLKMLQYEFYISTGFDLGIFSSILFNISHHGRIFDGLNQVNGFSGHVWPGAFLLAPFMLIWNDPRILLVIQTFSISLIFPITCTLAKQMNVEDKHIRYLILILIFNIYLHWVSSFDFHPETVAMPMILIALWSMYMQNYSVFYLFMLTSMTFKEDIFLAWVSLGIFFLISGKNREAKKVLIPATIYGFFITILVFKFVNLNMMVNMHYRGNHNMLLRIKPAVEFFTSFGFLPLFSLKGIVSYIIPFLEHILSSRPLHYKLRCQYSAILLPLIIFTSLLVVKNLKIKSWILASLVTIAILFSINEGPIRRYIIFSRLDMRKKAYLDRLLSTIPQSENVSLGNHLSPHLSTKDGVYQFPIIKDASLVIIDTTWHDFTPITSDSGLKILRSLITSGKFKLISDSLGIIILKKAG